MIRSIGAKKSNVKLFIKIIGLIAIVIIIFAFFWSRAVNSETSSNKLSGVEPTYEAFQDAIANADVSVFEIDLLIAKILSNSNKDDVRNLILNDYTSKRNFVTVKKEFDNESLKMLIRQKKIYSKDAEWILDKIDDYETLVFLYNFLSIDHPEELARIGEKMVQKNILNEEFIVYLIYNPSRSDEFNNLLIREINSFVTEVT